MNRQGDGQSGANLIFNFVFLDTCVRNVIEQSEFPLLFLCRHLQGGRSRPRTPAFIEAVENFINVKEKTTPFGAWIWQPCLTKRVGVLFALL